MNEEKKTMTDLCHGTGEIDGEPCPGCDECRGERDESEQD